MKEVSVPFLMNYNKRSITKAGNCLLNKMENFINSQLELSAFFDLTPDLVCIAGVDGYFKKINAAFVKKLGFTEKELFEKPISAFIFFEDQDRTRAIRSNLLLGQTLQNFQNRYVTKSGQIIWLEWTSIYFSDNKFVLAIAKDITERKELEKIVEVKYNKFKSLATHFKKSIEKDRKFLAYTLHEELAQLASVVKMDLDMITLSNPTLPESVKERIEHATTLSHLLINTIKRISFSISPAMLSEFGLTTTLEWLCKEFELLNGIPCIFKGEYNEAILTHEKNTDFFRICQESLTNIMYHANASNVSISIIEDEISVTLSITDDGKGFNINEIKNTSGINSMLELASSINGHLTIQSKPGVGTSVQVRLEK